MVSELSRQPVQTVWKIVEAAAEQSPPCFAPQQPHYLSLWPVHN